MDLLFQNWCQSQGQFVVHSTQFFSCGYVPFPSCRTAFPGGSTSPSQMGKSFPVLVHLCCCNEIPETRLSVNNRDSFFTILEAKKPRTMCCQMVPGQTCFLLCTRCDLVLCPHKGEGVRGVFRGIFYKRAPLRGFMTRSFLQWFGCCLSFPQGLCVVVNP